MAYAKWTLLVHSLHFFESRMWRQAFRRHRKMPIYNQNLLPTTAARYRNILVCYRTNVFEDTFSVMKPDFPNIL